MTSYWLKTMRPRAAAAYLLLDRLRWCESLDLKHNASQRTRGRRGDRRRSSSTRPRIPAGGVQGTLDSAGLC
ncbi:hypothetical protein LXA43DRAFT_1010051 [Ganoderma leucocontextum]|nr:hypothetical protein LXA43DRAFT_1010051 [Ganoderma leucocontextum]